MSISYNEVARISLALNRHRGRHPLGSKSDWLSVTCSESAGPQVLSTEPFSHGCTRMRWQLEFMAFSHFFRAVSYLTNLIPSLGTRHEFN